MNIMKTTAILATAMILAVCAPAHADPAPNDVDTTFLRLLTADNIPFKDGGMTIALAKTVCTNLRQGYSYFYNTSAVAEMNPTWTPFQTGVFVGAAIAAYCPDQHDKMPLPPKN
jgi:hypothetical protein